MGIIKKHFGLLLGIILLSSFLVISIPSVDALKQASGTYLTKISEPTVCGDFISERKCSTSEKLNRYLASKGESLIPGSRFMIGGVAQQSLQPLDSSLAQQSVGFGPVTSKKEFKISYNVPDELKTSKKSFEKIFSKNKFDKNNIITKLKTKTFDEKKIDLNPSKKLIKSKVLKLDSGKINSIKKDLFKINSDETSEKITDKTISKSKSFDSQKIDKLIKGIKIKSIEKKK